MSASGNDGEVEDSKRLEMCVLPVDSCDIADMVSEKSVLQHNVLSMLWALNLNDDVQHMGKYLPLKLEIENTSQGWSRKWEEHVDK